MKSLSEFSEYKQRGQKFSMVTCYDFPFARILEKSEVDCLLVGDSVAMVVHGHRDTLAADLPMMELHTASVRRGAPEKFLVSDLPFMSYRKGNYDTLKNMERLMRVGANALKLEGARGNLKVIQHAVDSGIPIMGHLGLTPQSIHQLGGFKVQGKQPQEYERILREAQELEQAGCFAVVLECVPMSLATEISSRLQIPTIGIGAGVGTDGQVLVLHDLLGFQPDFTPKFLRRYGQSFEGHLQAFNHFAEDVKAATFPTEKESYR